MTDDDKITDNFILMLIICTLWSAWGKTCHAGVFLSFFEPSRGIMLDSSRFSFLPLVSLALCISVSNTEVIHRFIRSKTREMIGFLLTVSRVPALVKLTAHAGFFYFSEQRSDFTSHVHPLQQETLKSLEHFVPCWRYDQHMTTQQCGIILVKGSEEQNTFRNRSFH